MIRSPTAIRSSLPPLLLPQIRVVGRRLEETLDRKDATSCSNPYVASDALLCFVIPLTVRGHDSVDPMVTALLVSRASTRQKLLRAPGAQCLIL